MKELLDRMREAVTYTDTRDNEQQAIHDECLKYLAHIVREHDKHEHASFALECSEQARADERDRCVQAIESLDRSDEKVLGKHTKNFNKGVNVGLKLSIQAIRKAE